MDQTDYEELRNTIFNSAVLRGSNVWSSTISTYGDNLRDLLDGIPRAKYKEIGDAGNWHIVKIYDREVRNWLKEQELHLWSQNTDGSYDVHNSLWCMLCLRWEQ